MRRRVGTGLLIVSFPLWAVWVFYSRSFDVPFFVALLLGLALGGGPVRLPSFRKR